MSTRRSTSSAACLLAPPRPPRAPRPTAPSSRWHVAQLRVRTDWLSEQHPNVEADQPTTTVLRCWLVKREHAAGAGDLAAALAKHLAAAATRASEAPAPARPAR